VVEMYISAISIETSMDGPQKTKNRTTLWSSNIWSIYLKEYKSGYSRDTYTPMFIAVLFTIAKLYK
jgi:hypothetical protein